MVEPCRDREITMIPHWSITGIRDYLRGRSHATRLDAAKFDGGLLYGIRDNQVLLLGDGSIAYAKGLRSAGVPVYGLDKLLALRG